MSNLTRWEPMRELQTMRSMMDRFFDEPFFATPSLWSQRGENFPDAQGQPHLVLIFGDQEPGIVCGYGVDCTVLRIEPVAGACFHLQGLPSSRV